MGFTMRSFFIMSVGVLLTLTALAKLLTAFAGSPVVYQHDPILGLQFHHEFLAIGAVEMAIACVCLFTRRANLQLGLVVWLSTSFAVYRFGLWLVGIDTCPCLGNFSDAIHLSKTSANAITIGILAYFLIGSYIGLINKWMRKPVKPLE